MAILVGDANADRAVNSADTTVTSNNSGQQTNSTNFRTDYNADGIINSARRYDRPSRPLCGGALRNCGRRACRRRGRFMLAARQCRARR